MDPVLSREKRTEWRVYVGRPAKDDGIPFEGEYGESTMLAAHMSQVAKVHHAHIPKDIVSPNQQAI